ncbi:MAG: tRNA guanosine(34) transglycosylase Tgt [Candidatus Parcubacteria bacterium]|nr:tRNA guanosine(34) transglycosylase Tgt [Candidatus Paceibacterota bacterium]
MSQNIFNIEHRCSKSKARSGQVTLARGVVNTPIFMPIGTLGSVKSLTNQDLLNLRAEIILGNTYHLWLKPDMEIMQQAGGLHKFGGWKRPILTDSGGFQAFSLSKIRKFTEEGVTFRVPASGQKRFLSPEISMQIQTTLDSDIALVLDECLPAEATFAEASSAMHRTHRWAKRSKTEYERLKKLAGHSNHLFGIPQGAQFSELRKQSAQMIKELDFVGYSIGGVANGGEPEEIMYSQVVAQTEILEDHKPRHLLGVGTPRDIVQMVARGIDMFDCVYPTRNARHGSLVLKNDENSYKIVHISASRYATDFSPINPDSRIPELREYTKAYLCHLFRSKELLAYRLATLQNLEFYIDLMDTIKAKIKSDTFGDWWQTYDRVK